MPGQLEDPAYEMMRGHKTEVRLKRDIAGHAKGETALIMASIQGSSDAELRFKGNNTMVIVDADDFERVE